MNYFELKDAPYPSKLVLDALLENFYSFITVYIFSLSFSKKLSQTLLI